MKVKVGCDIQYIPKFKKAIETRGKTFLENLFCAQELANNDKIQSLSGLFAIKEAIIKAVGLKPGCWKSIEVIKRDNGKPDAVIHGLGVKVISQDITISHDQDYSMAVACFIIDEITN